MPRTCELDDVFQEALRGLDEAAWRFDGSRGTFKSFARPRVEGQVRDWQRTQDLAWSRLHKRRWAETVPLVSVAEEGFRHERELDIEQRSEPRPERALEASDAWAKILAMLPRQWARAVDLY